MQIRNLIRRHRRPLLAVLALLLLGAAFLVWSNVAVARHVRYVYSDPERLPERRVGLVLGTRPGSNRYFVNRMQAAAELYHAGKVKKLLLSGDHGRKDYNEPEAMRDALIELGVPAEDLVLDYAGFRTLDSMLRSQEVFEAGPVTVISQEFHCIRAVYLARSHGIDAVGFAAADVPWRRYRLRMLLRELLARPAAWCDVNLLHRRPRYLGEKLPI